jgi:hypothetical protein
MTDREDARLFAHEIVTTADARDPAFHPSAPILRTENLARAFLAASSWCAPVVKAEVKPKPEKVAKPRTKTWHPGRGGRKVEVNGVLYKSLTQAASEMGVHRVVVSRMVRDGEAKFVT